MIRTLLLVTNCFFCAIVMAQNIPVKGTVTDQEDGQPLTGVTVIVKGTSKGAATDLDGNYSIELAPGETTLVFSYIGYITQTVDVNGQEAVNVVLRPDVKLLNDVVVVGYGTQKKSDLTGSVSTVRGADL